MRMLFAFFAIAGILCGIAAIVSWWKKSVINLVANIGITGLDVTQLGYQFLDINGAFIGSRQTANIYEFANAAGSYGVAAPTIPPNAVAVTWNSLAVPEGKAFEAFDLRFPIDGPASGAGSGAFPITITVQDALAVPIQNANVRTSKGITSNLLITDSSGQVTFQLDAGSWTGGVTAGGYVGQSISGTVTGIQAGTLVQTVTLNVTTPLIPPTNPQLCAVGGYFINPDGTPAVGLVLTFKLKANGVVKAGATVVQTEWSSPPTDINGFTVLNLIKNTEITNQSRTVWLMSNPQLNMDEVQLYLTGDTYNIGNA